MTCQDTNNLKMEISDYLLKEFDFNDNDVNEVISEFRTNFSDLLISAENQLESLDWMKLSKTAHSIKGVAANIGSKTVSKQCEILEELAGNQDENGCRIIISKLKRMLIEQL